MNIDLLCGHETMLHCGCKVCARNEAFKQAAKVAEELFWQAIVEDDEAEEWLAEKIRARKDAK